MKLVKAKGKILKGSRRKSAPRRGLQSAWWLTSQNQWGQKAVEWHDPTAERKPGDQEFYIQQNCSSKVRRIRKINQWNSLSTRPALNIPGKPSCWMEITAEAITFRKKRALEMVKAQVNITESTNVSSHVLISVRDTTAWNWWVKCCGVRQRVWAARRVGRPELGQCGASTFTGLK